MEEEANYEEKFLNRAQNHHQRFESQRILVIKIAISLRQQ